VKTYAFLFWAYNVIWLGLALYLLRLTLQLRRADRRLDDLEREAALEPPDRSVKP
jgi:CcmD family protein